MHRFIALYLVLVLYLHLSARRTPSIIVWSGGKAHVEKVEETGAVQCPKLPRPHFLLPCFSSQATGCYLRSQSRFVMLGKSDYFPAVLASYATLRSSQFLANRSDHTLDSDHRAFGKWPQVGHTQRSGHSAMLPKSWPGYWRCSEGCGVICEGRHRPFRTSSANASVMIYRRRPPTSMHISHRIAQTWAGTILSKRVRRSDRICLHHFQFVD